ncbi:MAG: radical SAM protein, partial [Elusimicrobiota bacterium]
DGAIRRNGLRPLIEDLDSMPFYDRDIYFGQYPLLRDLSNKRFLVQRGCPYSCSFCFNHSFREMYGGLGKFVRFRSPGNIVREIERVRSLYPLKSVSFNADSFTLHPQFLELLALYRERVGLPFFSNARFNELDGEKIAALKEAGCSYLAIGVESGSERIRNGILHRNMSDSVITGNAALLKKHGIPFSSYVMLGLPTETLEEAVKTLEFLSAIGSDTIMPSIYKPLVGTGLWDFMRQNDLFDGAAVGKEDGVKLPDRRELFNLYKLSHVAVRFPRLMPLIKKLIKLPENPLFQLIFYYNTFAAARVSRNMDFWEMLRLSWKLLKTMNFKNRSVEARRR